MVSNRTRFLRTSIKKGGDPFKKQNSKNGCSTKTNSNISPSPENSLSKDLETKTTIQIVSQPSKDSLRAQLFIDPPTQSFI